MEFHLFFMAETTALMMVEGLIYRGRLGLFLWLDLWRKNSSSSLKYWTPSLSQSRSFQKLMPFPVQKNLKRIIRDMGVGTLTRGSGKMGLE